MIPGLLFDPRQNSSCGLLDLEIERHIACSLAPDPTTNIFSLFIFKAGLSVRIEPALFKTTQKLSRYCSHIILSSKN